MHPDTEVSVGIGDVDAHGLGLNLIREPRRDPRGKKVDVPLESDIRRLESLGESIGFDGDVDGSKEVIVDVSTVILFSEGLDEVLGGDGRVGEGEVSES